MSAKSIRTGACHTPALVLASTSPRRRDLLLEHRFTFTTITTGADELSDPALGPARLVAANARLKAFPVAALHPDCVVIGADTVVALGNTILGKPTSLQEAAAMLETLQGKEHTVLTGVCILHASVSRESEFVETTRVRFRTLSVEQRIAYHLRINPLDKAGGYAAQDDRGQLIEETVGSFSNVIGLPMETLTQHLQAFGIVAV